MSSLWNRFLTIWSQSRTKDAILDNEGRLLIVGLGNPGKKYAANRHNIGFMAVNRLADANNISMSRVQQRSLIGSGRIGDQAVILAKPQAFMNRSGEAVGSLARFYKIGPENRLIIYDELDLPFGSIRLRQKGGAGGHNGMRSVIQHIGSDFPRLRLGIGRPPGQMDPAAYVLQDFRKQDEELLDEILDEAVATVDSFIRDGVDLAMTRHNKK